MPREYFCASVPTHEVRKLRQVDSVPVWSLVEDIPSKQHLWENNDWQDLKSIQQPFETVSGAYQINSHS